LQEESEELSPDFLTKSVRWVERATGRGKSHKQATCGGNLYDLRLAAEGGKIHWVILQGPLNPNRKTSAN
jgi:hypothetical protein